MSKRSWSKHQAHTEPEAPNVDHQRPWPYEKKPFVSPFRKPNQLDTNTILTQNYQNTRSTVLQKTTLHPAPKKKSFKKKNGKPFSTKQKKTAKPEKKKKKKKKKKNTEAARNAEARPTEGRRPRSSSGPPS